MFAAVSHQVVKSVGKEKLLAIPSLEDSSKIKMLNVVMKRSKRSFIFWKKVYYNPYDVPLEVILVKKGLEIKENTETICKYNRENSFSLSGQLGADIMDGLMDFNLKGSNSVTVKFDLDEITKVNVEPNQLMNELQNRNLDMDHAIVRQICNNKKKVMCVVTEVLSLVNAAAISRVDDFSAEADATANIPNGTLKVSGNFHKENKRGFGLPEGTSLAYNVVELKVNTISGSIEPIIALDMNGGFYIESPDKDEIDGPISVPAKDEIDGAISVPDKDEIDGPISGPDKDEIDGAISSPDIDEIDGAISGPDKDIETDGPEGSGSDTIASILQPILDLDPDTRNEIKSIILRMVTVPSDIYVMSDLINKVEDDEDLSEGSARNAFTMDILSLEKNLTTAKDLWMRLFEIMGFHLKTEKEPPMPESSIPLLNAFGHIFDALAEISANDLDILRSVSDEARKGLLQLCKFTMDGKPVMELDGETKSVIQDVNGRKLAEKIGYNFKETNVTIPNGPEKPSPELEQVYWVLYALHG